MRPGSIEIDLDIEDIDFSNVNMNKITTKPAFSEQIVNKKTGLPDAPQMGEGEPFVLHRCAGRDISIIDTLKRGVGAWYNKKNELAVFRCAGIADTAMAASTQALLKNHV